MSEAIKRGTLPSGLEAMRVEKLIRQGKTEIEARRIVKEAQRR